MHKSEDLTGKKVGRLLVIKNVRDSNNRITWLCRCDCGNTTYYKTGDLKRGRIKSCGCLKIENNKARSMNKVGKTRIYNEWQNIKARCINPKASHYESYGGRGISVCEEWINDFGAFRKWAIENGYDDTLTIDRIDTNQGYSPQNCRWVNMKIQCRNKRNNHYLTFRGKTQVITDWANELGISYKVLYARLKLGWSVEETLTIPILKYGQKLHKKTKED